MEKQEVIRIISKLNDIISSIRYQNSAADIHEVNNIRHTATLLMEQLKAEPDCMKDELVNQILQNVQDRLIKFYKQKYYHV